MSFDSLGLQATLLQAVQDSGYTTPTPIQTRAIPAILSGSDVMAAAQTGTGKTAGFTLPLLQLLSAKPGTTSNQVRALVLTPTRELAAQIQESIETYGKHEKLRSVVVFGGVNINPQQLALRKGADILVATPGRLLDLYQQNAVKFNALEILVLDEADRMLDMGFIRDIRKILALLPKQRQNLLFSATFSDEIRTLAKTLCHTPVEIDVAPRNSTVDAISQSIYRAEKDQKLPLLAKLLLDTKDQVLVFSRTKHGANNLVKKLSHYGVNSAAIHGNKSQAQRTKALAGFKDNTTQVLIATDIAARGLDIEQLSMVINYELPQVPEDYVHRIGRTGRAGATGLAVSLVSNEENVQLRAIERLIKRKIDVAVIDPASLPTPPVRAEGSTDNDDERPERPARRAQAPRRGQGQGQGQGQRRRSTGDAKPAFGAQQPRAARSNNNAQPGVMSSSSSSTDGFMSNQGQGNGGGKSGGRSSSRGSKPQGRSNPNRAGGAPGNGNSVSAGNRPPRANQQPQAPKGEVNGNRMDATQPQYARVAEIQASVPGRNSQKKGFWGKMRTSITGR